MRTLQLSFILLTLFKICASPVRAEKPENFQAGYIVIASDTIKGFVQAGDHSLNTKRCIFKETPNGPERIYSPDDLMAYGTVGKTLFLSADIQIDQPNGRQVFVECIVKSNVSLFFYRDRFFINGINGWEELSEVKEKIQKNGKTFTVNRPFYKSILQQQLSDCAAIHEKLVDTQLTKKSLLALFVNYASCAGHESTVFESTDSNNTTTRYGFTVGLLAAQLNMKSRDNIRYIFAENSSGNTSFTFTPSFFIELGFSKRVDLCTGISYYFTRNELRAQNSGGNLSHHFLLEASRIEVPILIKYTLSRGDVKWSLKGGCAVDGVVKYKDQLTVSSTSSGFILNEYNNDLKKNGIVMNFMGGACAEFSLKNRSFLIEGLYSRSGSLVSSSTHASIEAFRFSFGMFL